MYFVCEKIPHVTIHVKWCSHILRPLWMRGGDFFQLRVTKALEIREVQSKVWTSPNWTSWQRSNREGLAPLTKKQYSGTWTLDKGATERVCAAEWLRRLSEGFGQGGADRAENLLTRFFWQCELSDCWELNYSKHSPGNHRIPLKQTADCGDQQRLGAEKQVQALKSELDLDPE